MGDDPVEFLPSDDTLIVMKTYLARVWTEPPGTLESDPFVEVSFRFRTLAAAKSWAEREVEAQPYATGGASIWEVEADESWVVWERDV